MSIKKKLLLTNVIVFAVMVVLAVAYNLFYKGLLDKYSVMSTDAAEIAKASEVLMDTTIQGREKADALAQYRYKYSVYNANDKGTCVASYGYELKGYTFTSTAAAPIIVVMSNKIVLESRQGNYYHAAVVTSEHQKQFELFNGLAITIMIIACGVVVFLACYYQFYTLFPPLKVLRSGLKQIALGNYAYQLRATNHDEIGAVIGEFEMMRRKLNDLNQQKSDFDRQRGETIAGISHDLKTPLTTIRGYTKGLLDGVANTPEKQERYLRTIYETTGTMNSLVNKLNDFAKMDMDKMEYSFMERDLVKVLSDFASINVPIYATKGLIVTTDFPKEAVEADIDKEQFLRVIQNILDNSVKYKEKKEGHALIKVRSVKNTAVLEISDDGPGVSPHELKYIFESYYRGDPSRTNPTTGSGLGLSIVKTIVTAHEGEVYAESEDGFKIIIKLPQRRKRN